MRHDERGQPVMSVTELARRKPAPLPPILPDVRRAQSRALAYVMGWLANKSPVFKLGGAAGVGKTSVGRAAQVAAIELGLTTRRIGCAEGLTAGMTSAMSMIDLVIVDEVNERTEIRPIGRKTLYIGNATIFQPSADYVMWREGEHGRD